MSSKSFTTSGQKNWEGSKQNKKFLILTLEIQNWKEELIINANKILIGKRKEWEMHPEFRNAKNLFLDRNYRVLS